MSRGRVYRHDASAVATDESEDRTESAKRVNASAVRAELSAAPASHALKHRLSFRTLYEREDPAAFVAGECHGAGLFDGHDDSATFRVTIFEVRRENRIRLPCFHRPQYTASPAASRTFEAGLPAALLIGL